MGMISDLHQPDGTSSDSETLPSTSVNADSKPSSPHLSTSEVIPSGPAALLCFTLGTVFVTSVRDGVYIPLRKVLNVRQVKRSCRLVKLLLIVFFFSVPVVYPGS
uniref:Uncharacterized protein n=1 Tax=Trichobilharzia regenti TaxID=157069 RepID=A0AA85IPS7_TRIRE|nr:unnamed protein product [Trichobilharzia regenti]